MTEAWWRETHEHMSQFRSSVITTVESPCSSQRQGDGIAAIPCLYSGLHCDVIVSCPRLNFDTLLSRSKLDKRLHILLTCFWYISIWYFHVIHTHFIQFRYDFLSSFIIWYTFEYIKVHLIYFWVYQNCIKNKSKYGVQFWSAQKSKFSQGLHVSL